MDLDNLDKKLIVELTRNGRLSNAELARSLGISISTAAKRIEALVKHNILVISAVPNPFMIQHNGVFIGIRASVDKVESIGLNLKKQFGTLLVAGSFGRFNLLSALYFQSLDELKQILSSVLSESEGVLESEIFFVKSVKKLFGEDLNWRETSDNPFKIDQIDRGIIDQLSADGRRSGVYLAQNLGISESLVSKRLARLIKEDIIQIRAHLNDSAFGLSVTAYLFLRVEPSKVDSLCAELLPLPEVATIMTLNNGYNIHLNVSASTLEELWNFIQTRLTPSRGVFDQDVLINASVKKSFYSVSNVNRFLLD